MASVVTCLDTNALRNCRKNEYINELSIALIKILIAFSSYIRIILIEIELAEVERNSS